LPDEEAPKKTCYQAWIDPLCNVGSLSNIATFCVFLIGAALRLMYPVEPVTTESTVATYVLSFGLFGFAGGITNELAVKMLFDRIPFLPGSGVIPRQFKEIRAMVKNTMLKTFFDREFLTRYAIEKAGDFQQNTDIEGMIRRLLESDAVDKIIEVNLGKLDSTPTGGMLGGMGVPMSSMKPMVKPMIVGMSSEAAPMLMSQFRQDHLSEPVDKFVQAIDSLMEMKLAEMTPEKVKELMEVVIREHLGWLIVWGNVFGGLIGIVSVAAGYGGTPTAAEPSAALLVASTMEAPFASRLMLSAASYMFQA
jgi:hypothetical protein